jgi:hypothetical protein
MSNASNSVSLPRLIALVFLHQWNVSFPVAIAIGNIATLPGSRTSATQNADMFVIRGKSLPRVVMFGASFMAKRKILNNNLRLGML